MFVQWNQYKGKELCILDYNNIPQNEIISFARQATQDILNSGKSDLRYLVNMDGVIGSKDVLAVLKEEGKRTEHITTKMAVLGIDGIKKVLFSAYNRFTGGKSKIFHDETSAKEWLIL